MGTLFDIDKSSISRHIKNIFETEELEQQATIATIQNEGNRQVKRTINNTIQSWEER